MGESLFRTENAVIRNETSLQFYNHCLLVRTLNIYVSILYVISNLDLIFLVFSFYYPPLPTLLWFADSNNPHRHTVGQTDGRRPRLAAAFVW